ncbi:MAG: histidine triad nucleotide-binding protein [Planctomycetaceae bacterium]|nr:histidine triad nucleotide-binding protein [Planctomycetaceae bacterium]|tara:strand:+ start:616 stop:963 length:348 start_codon:yes stop_codon:yes gene_type:complete
MSEPTIFKRIIDGEIPANIIYEDEHCLAFHDVAPQAPVHILVIPKKEIASIEHLEGDDKELIGHLFLIIQKIARQQGLAEDGYRVICNCGEGGGQTVFHLHYHLIGGRSLQWPPG